MAAPTFVGEYEGPSWDTTTSPKTTGTFNASVGDVLVACLADENDNGSDDYSITNSGTAQTWTESETAGVTDGDSWAMIATAVCSATLTGAAVTGTAVTSSGNKFGLTVAHFSGSDGIGARATGGAGTATASLDITTTAANSAIVYIAVDWNASDLTSRTHRTVNGTTPTSGNGLELASFRNAANYALVVAYIPDAGAAGLKTVGMSAPSGGDWTMVAVEVKGTASTGQSGTGTISASGTLTSSGTAGQAGTGSISATGALTGSGGGVETPDPIDVFDGTWPAAQTAHDDGQPITVGNAFHVPLATTDTYTTTGARLYIDPTHVAALPTTVTVHLYNTADFSLTPAETVAGVSVGSGGWIDITWTAPHALSPGVPKWVAYSFGNDYLATTSPTTAAIVSPDSVLRVSETTPDPGWSRSLYRYGTGATSTAAGTLWGVDMVVTFEETAVSGTGSIGSTGTLTSSGTQNQFGNGLLDFYASLTASGSAGGEAGEDLSGAGSISATAALTASGQEGQAGTGTISVVSSETASGSEAMSGTGTLTIIATLTADGEAPTFFFTPPTYEEPIRTMVLPLAYYRLTQASSVVKVNGIFQTIRSPHVELLTGEEGVDYFMGGHVYEITQDVATGLVAAGYEVLEEEPS